MKFQISVTASKVCNVYSSHKWIVSMLWVNILWLCSVCCIEEPLLYTDILNRYNSFYYIDVQKAWYSVPCDHLGIPFHIFFSSKKYLMLSLINKYSLKHIPMIFLREELFRSVPRNVCCPWLNVELLSIYICIFLFFIFPFGLYHSGKIEVINF